MKCTCGKIILGVGKKARVAGHVWRDKCLEHGLGTEWYNTIGKASHERDRQQAITLQKRAREARVAYKASHGSNAQ